jgi:hypothetical protein
MGIAALHPSYALVSGVNMSQSVIASEAKQSIFFFLLRQWIASSQALLAMTLQ